MLPNRRQEIAGPTGRLSVRTVGSPDCAGEPILFVHPINLQGRAWYQVAIALADEHFCVLPDMRGHGTSDAVGPFGTEHWAADCIAALDAVGVERAHVVGGSAGGPIAVYLAVHHADRVASITTFGSSLGRAGQGPNHVADQLAEMDPEQMFRSLLPEISFAPDTPQTVIELALALANPNRADVIADIWTASGATDVRPIAGQVACSARVITGAEDRTSSVEAGQALAEAIGAKFAVWDGIGHLPLVECPDRVVAEVREHLAEIATASPA